MAKINRSTGSDFFLLLVSLFLGFLVWVIIRHQDTEISTVPVQVKLNNLPPFVVVEDYQPKQVFLVFSFRRADELMIGQSDRYSATIDASELGNRQISTTEAEEITLRLQDTDIGNPAEVRFLRFKSSREVTVKARLRTAKALVRPTFTNSTPEAQVNRDVFIDYDNVIVEPETVDVAVSEERARFIATQPLIIATEPIDLAGQIRNLTGRYRLDYTTEPGVFPIPVTGQETVDVLLDIRPFISTVKFKALPITIPELPGIDRVDTKPRTVDVEISGPQSIIRSLQQEQIRVQSKENLLTLPYLGNTMREVELQVSYSLDVPEVARSLTATLSTTSALLTFVVNPESTEDNPGILEMLEIPGPVLEPVAPAVDDSETTPAADVKTEP
ncbi:MAG: hypothetical protein SFY68_06725 [Candidatus Sumerlaeia bacterium]|nr:hypothetical protein [Candidatus Sumerlaeia bacterium]